MATTDQFAAQDDLDPGLRDKVRRMLQRVSAEDLLGSRYHSRDFTSSRAEYVSVRIRILSFLFAVLAPLWIPIDFIAMDDETFGSIVAMRIGYSLALVALGSWSGGCNLIYAARLRVVLFVTVSGLFYTGSRLLFDGNGESGVLVGYSFLPFLIVALLAVVPLTLIEGLSFVLYAGAFLVGAELWFGTLFSLPTLGNVWLLALLAMIALWVQMTQLHMLLRLYREATRDALTGLVNRRVLFRWLDREIAATGKTGQPLSVILFDLDLFKRINDNHGHLAGDAVLQAFGQLLRRTLPMTELVGRYGGEEFLAILPGASSRQAEELAEQVRTRCHETPVRNPDGGDTLHFTTSSGVAELRPGENGEMLLARVDQGLYQAKEAGRDLVTVAA